MDVWRGNRRKHHPCVVERIPARSRYPAIVPGDDRGGRPRPGRARGAVVIHVVTQSTKNHFRRWEVASDVRGRYWDRTSDLFGVNEALSR
jgi:hypothetical protein